MVSGYFLHKKISPANAVSPHQQRDFNFLLFLYAIRPISRVMSLGNHLSRPYVAIRLKRPT